MVIDIITLLPEIIQPTIDFGVVGRACKDDIVSVKFWNPRKYTDDLHHTVDARPYGGGPGMVMMYEPIKKALDEIEVSRGSRGYRIYLSPQGRLLNQALLREYSGESHLVLLCGRYEGVDQRLIDTEIDCELSIGDYVLSGGELAAGVFIDGLIRLLPNVLSNQASHENDSFSDGDLLDHPHYTRPRSINGLEVPEVLFSGDHEKIKIWRAQQARMNTEVRRNHKK